MQRVAVVAAALILVMVAMPASAGDRRYVHKAGATPEIIDVDQSECFEAGKLAMRKPSAPNPYNPATDSSAAGAAGSGFAHGMARGLEGARAFKLTYFNCLDMKGYTQRAMPSAEWKAIKKLPDAEQRARLAALMTASEPQHPEMPRDEYD